MEGGRAEGVVVEEARNDGIFVSDAAKAKLAGLVDQHGGVVGMPAFGRDPVNKACEGQLHGGFDLLRDGEAGAALRGLVAGYLEL